MIGMASGVVRAVRWKASYMSAQPVALLSAGAEPPPESTEPIRYVARSPGWPARAARSTWVICPIFSSSDIRDSRSSTRAATGRLGSWYGRAASGSPPGVVHAVTTSRTAAGRRRLIIGINLFVPG